VQLYEGKARRNRQKPEQELLENPEDISTNAFVLFDSHHNALMAKNKLDYHIFDQLTSQTIRVNLAEKNLILSRQEAERIGPRRPEGPPPEFYPPSVVMPPSGPWSYEAAPPPPTLNPFPTSFPPPSYIPSPSYVPTPSYIPPPPTTTTPRKRHPDNNGTFGKQRTVYPPINTLFISNIDQYEDSTFIALMQTCEGFKEHKLTYDARVGAKIGFVEFATIQQAEEAMSILQAKGINAAFAKNPLNKRKNDII